MRNSYAASPRTPGTTAGQFLALAVRYDVRATTHVYPMSQAQQALQDLKAGLFDGAAVLVNDGDGPQ